MSKTKSEIENPRHLALDLNRNISVTAGAGAGKTSILVERFLKIALQGDSLVRRTLAVTFTKKAAGEMQERVARKVNERLQSDLPGPERRRLLAIRDQLNSASISTIHSFCAKALHEFPLEAGLSPDFDEIDEMEQIILIEEAIRLGFEQIDQTEPGEQAGRWLDLFIRLGRNAVNDMLRQALDKPWEMQELEQRFGLFTEDTWCAFLDEQRLAMLSALIPQGKMIEIYQLVCRILDADHFSDAKNEGGAKVRAALSGFRSSHERAPNSPQNYDRFLELTALLTGDRGAPYKTLNNLGKKESWNLACREGILQLSADLADAAARLHRHNPGSFAGENDREWFGLFRVFLDLYKIAAENYRQLKAARGAVDFEDLQILMARLLQGNEPARRQLAQRFEYIMVDEFQDTNDLQWQIIRALASGESGAEAGNVFIVGDPKQSIYGFRSADVRTFKHVKACFASQAGYEHESEYNGNIVFRESYRFLPRLNAFINFAFSAILQPEEPNPFGVEFHALQAMRNFPERGWTELAILPVEEDGSYVEADYIAERINRLITEGATCFHSRDESETPMQYGDIAILLRSRTHLLTIEQALRRCDIPFKTAGGVGFWQRQEVFDFFHLLRFLDNPADDFALVAILRARFFCIPDSALFMLARESAPTYLGKITADRTTPYGSDQEKESLRRAVRLIGKWLQCRDHLNVNELLEMVISDLNLNALFAAELNGEQLLANLEKFIAYAQAFDMSAISGLHDFITHVDDLIEREMREGEAQINLEDQGAVKIMTIHAAKGLQFPVVFAPFLNSARGGGRRPVLLDAGLGLAMPFKSSDEDSANGDHLIWRLLKYRQYQKENAEARRLFYVAATRAADYLFLCAGLKKEQPQPDSALQWLAEAFARDRMDLLQTASFTHKGFRLEIVRNLPSKVSAGNEFATFFSGMAQLKRLVTDENRTRPPLPDYLRAVEAKPSGLTFSATRLLTWLENPQEYYRRYHLGFFENDYETFASDVYHSDLSLLKGKLLHRLLEIIPHGAGPQDELISQVLFEFDVLDETLRCEMAADLAKMLQQALQSEAAASLIHAAEYRNETAVTTRLGQDYLTGTLDRLFRNPQGQWEVADYKTNRITAENVETSAAHYRAQTDSYALLLSRLHPEQPVYPVSLYFIVPDVVYRLEYHAEDIRRIQAFFLKTLQEIQEKMPLGVKPE